ncbi:MAG: hypothetical protein ACO27L_08070 [Schleiferiaceae bacterium]
MAEELVKPVNSAAKIRMDAEQKRAEEKLRASMMAMDRVAENKSIAELARTYHMTPAKVKDHLALANASGFYQQFESLLLEKLVPPSLAVYEAHLERGSLEAARDILFGMGILRKTPKETEQSGVETIEAYRIVRAQQPTTQGD